MSTEQWRPIPDFVGVYEVSDTGRVRSVDRWIVDACGARRFYAGRVLKQRKAPDGYMHVTLCRGGRRGDRRAQYGRIVHRLVLDVFVGLCPDGMEGCHNNGDRGDNRLSNLRWDTKSNNALDTVRHGNHPTASRTHCPQRHEYTPENTYARANGWRHCKKCTLAQQRQAYAARVTA